MPTIEQIRAARALVGWSQGELADHADLSQTGIARIENGTNQPNSTTIGKIISAFDKADVEFIGESGVKKRTGEIRTLRGTNGFRDFMNDVYEVASTEKSDICLFNTEPEKWIEYLGTEWYDMHNKRMSKIQGLRFRNAIREGNENFILDCCEYRWIPDEKWKDVTFYLYGNRLALLYFEKEEIRITVIQERNLADSFRIMFESAWKHDTIPIRK